MSTVILNFDFAQCWGYVLMLSVHFYFKNLTKCDSTGSHILFSLRNKVIYPKCNRLGPPFYSLLASGP